MSYIDDEEIKIGELGDDDDLDALDPLHEPLDDDIIPGEEDEDLDDGLAGLDGSAY